LPLIPGTQLRRAVDRRRFHGADSAHLHNYLEDAHQLQQQSDLSDFTNALHGALITFATAAPL
jgi:hypothetical protein